MMYGKRIQIYFVLLFVLFLKACDTDFIGSIQNFRFQIPFYFYVNYFDKSIPDTSQVFANLNEYEEFTKNKSRLEKAEIVQFNYWIDSLVYGNNQPFDPKKDTLVIENVRFFLVFAKPKPNIPNPRDTSDFEPDTTLPTFLLGEFKEVNVSDFYRKPNHIYVISTEISQVLTEVVRNRPYFYLVSEYGKVRGQTTPKKYFSLIFVRFDVVIRFTVSL
ncbi:MAG: hypothetical protein CH6_1127 [Candidatus Kapaibacterium sp.]|nr:MAG: hypothetical protein CH6_1127 [Candidatus Kapabacteria bacterium]